MSFHFSKRLAAAKIYGHLLFHFLRKIKEVRKIRKMQKRKKQAQQQCEAGFHMPQIPYPI